MTYLEAALLVGIVGLFAWAGLYLYFRRKPEQLSVRQGLVGLLIFGPFYPLIESSLRERNHQLTSRERWGVALVLTLLVLAIALSLVFGLGVRGR